MDVQRIHGQLAGDQAGEQGVTGFGKTLPLLQQINDLFEKRLNLSVEAINEALRRHQYRNILECVHNDVVKHTGLGDTLYEREPLKTAAFSQPQAA